MKSQLMFCVKCVLVGVLMLCGASVNSQTPSDVNTLLNNLFNDYNKKVRPVLFQPDAIVLDISLFLFSVNEVDEVSEKMVTTGYLDLTWNDALLQWDPNLNNDIRMVYLPQTDIWKPDLVLKNGFTKFKELGGDFYYLALNYTGDVFWYPYEVFQTRCAIDITYFPYDEQVCDISFIVWCYTANEVIITKSSRGINLYEYDENAIWTIADTYSNVERDTFESQITFTVVLHRKPQYYILNLILPIVCLGFLSQLVFIVPTEAGEKMSYAVTVFLALAVFLTMINAELPQNSESTSVLSIYLVMQMMTGALVLVISAVQLRLHHRKNTAAIPRFFVAIVKVERCLRCVKTCCHPANKTDDVTCVEKFDQKEEHFKETDIDWGDVTSAIDFLCFWIFLLLNISVTMFLFLYVSGTV